MSQPSKRTKAYIRTKSFIHYPEPRLMALTLAQYCTERSAKKRADIRQGARYLRIAWLIRNTESRHAIRQYLADVRRDRSVLHRTHASLTTRSQSQFVTDYQRETASKNLENLSRFMEDEQKLGLGAYGFEHVAHDQPALVIAGVPVSVDLDWLVTAPFAKNGQPQTGGAMLQLSKGGPLPDAAKQSETKARRIEGRANVNRFMAVLIHQHLEENFSQHGSPSREHCIVIDPFVPDVYPIYGRLDVQTGQLKEAAKEIADRWDKIPPPDDYDG